MRGRDEGWEGGKEVKWEGSRSRRESMSNGESEMEGRRAKGKKGNWKV